MRKGTNSMKSVTLKGMAAIKYAERHRLTLSKYNDPVEGPRKGLSPARARTIAAEDPSLIYLPLKKKPIRWRPRRRRHRY